MRRKCDIDINFKTMRKYLSTLLVASVLAASCTKDAEVIREKIVSQSRPILSGQGQPENTKGEDGDYYLDLANADLYGPKTKGAWGTPALNLKGAAGKDGKDGANGTNGTTPRIGDNGNWWVGNTDLGVKAQGAQGQKGQDGRNGQDGRDGQNGRDGAIPSIGDNGNWWVGDQDTGKPARGENGAPGRNGENGQNGADGSKILAEDRAPQASDGVVGDYFIDKDAKIFYGPKTASGWPTTGISLTGNLVVTTDYELSSDGKTLIKWLNGQTRIIDMNADPKLKLVEKIGINAFNGQTNNLTYQLATIVIGERVREIERFAFAQCKKLKEVEIPEGITKIDSGTFSNCYNLSSVILPESLTVVGNGAFSSCIKLHTIVLPKNVNTVGNNAFKNCPNLHSIVLENKTAFQIRPLQFGTGNTTLQNIFVPQGSKSAYENLMTDAAYKAKLKEIGI